VLQSASPLFRAARNLHQSLQSARDKVRQDRSIVELRDRASEIEREAELLYTDARHAMEYAIARQSEEQARLSNELNRSTHQLNMLASLFLPLTAIAPALGMNLTSGLEHASPTLFWLILLVALAAAL